jgi:hypothetical protein
MFSTFFNDATQYCFICFYHKTITALSASMEKHSWVVKIRHSLLNSSWMDGQNRMMLLNTALFVFTNQPPVVAIDQGIWPSSCRRTSLIFSCLNWASTNNLANTCLSAFRMVLTIDVCRLGLYVILLFLIYLHLFPLLLHVLFIDLSRDGHLY